MHEYPTVVDVDGDNEPEIVVPNGGGHNNEDARGVYIIGAEDRSWIGGPKVWNQHAYSHTNIENDLQIPSNPYPNWPLYNSFRSANLNPVYGESAPDAVPVAQVCTEDCANGNWQFFGGIGNYFGDFFTVGKWLGIGLASVLAISVAGLIFQIAFNSKTRGQAIRVGSAVATRGATEIGK